MELSELLNKIKNSILAIAPGAKTILYGSFARGEERPDSDLDILVLLPDTYKGKEFVSTKFKISDLSFDLSMESGIEISILTTVFKVFNSRKTPFTINVANEGIVL